MNFRSTVVIICLAVATVLLTLTSVLVMAEEFQQLPENLQKMSTKLVDNRTSRTVLICGVIILMAFASSLSLVINTSSSVPSALNKTKLFSPFLASIALASNKNRSKNALNDISLAATISHNDSGKDSFKYTEYNCTGNCFKDMIHTVGLKNLIPTIPKNLSHAKRTLEGMDRQIFMTNSSIGMTGVITSTYDDCPHPEYIVFTWVLCMIALATALKLYYLIKLFLAIVMVAVYSILILMGYNTVFTGDYISEDE